MRCEFGKSRSHLHRRRSIEALGHTSIGGGASMTDAASSTDGHQDPMPPAIPQEPDSTGFRKTGISKREEKRRRKISALKDQLKDLEDKSEEIDKRRIEIIRKISSLTDNDPNAEAKVIAFVEAIERANQYFELKGSLKKEKGLMMPDSIALEVFEGLIKDKKVQDTYDKLDSQDIMNAVDEHIVDLQTESDYKCCQLKQESSGARIPNPIIDLVYQIREKAFVMDQNPLVELDIIRKNHSLFYTHRFLPRLVEQYSEKKVIVENIPKGYEDKVRDSLAACGDIEAVELQRQDDFCSTAVVTFCNAEGAKLAPFLNKEARFIITPFLESPEWETDPELMTKFIKAETKYHDFRELAVKLGKQNCCCSA